MTVSFDAITDASTLGGFTIGGTTPKTQNTPQPVYVTAHAQLDYSDFNKSIEITPLPTG